MGRIYNSIPNMSNENALCKHVKSNLNYSNQMPTAILSDNRFQSFYFNSDF